MLIFHLLRVCTKNYLHSRNHPGKNRKTRIVLRILEKMIAMWNSIFKETAILTFLRDPVF